MTYAILSSLAIVLLAAGIHASLQLSVSMLTLMSGHALGKKTRHMLLLRRMNSFVIGVFLMTLLLATFTVHILTIVINQTVIIERLVASVTTGIAVGLGLATWAFYYRRKQKTGIVLWLPRGMARFLAKRSKATKSSAEAFSLGMTSVIAELIFIIGPLLAASLAIISLPSGLFQLSAILLYVVGSLLPLLGILILVGSGYNIAQIQQWREQSKSFLQFTGGSCLFILAFYLFIDRVMGITSMGIGW